MNPRTLKDCLAMTDSHKPVQVRQRMNPFFMPRSPAATLPKSPTGGIPGFLSEGERYALEQSPIDDDEVREAAEFEFGVVLDAS